MGTRQEIAMKMLYYTRKIISWMMIDRLDFALINTFHFPHMLYVSITQHHTLLKQSVESIFCSGMIHIYAYVSVLLRIPASPQQTKDTKTMSNVSFEINQTPELCLFVSIGEVWKFCN